MGKFFSSVFPLFFCWERNKQGWKNGREGKEHIKNSSRLLN